jgi:FkbM family methyltransferase
MSSPFFHYNSCFDPIELINKYTPANLKASPTHAVNFLGLKINPDFMPECIGQSSGSVELPPIPANWHADISEFGAVFRAVDLTLDNRFIMGEMGCGWGCWMGISGLVAKKRGLDVKLYGIEGDKKHISWAKENMVNNGFSEKEYAIVEGIASATAGKALFPLVDKETIHYGLEPIFNATDLEIQKALKNKSHEILPMVHLAKIFSGESRVDLLHIDIQGGEVDLIRGSMDYLSKHVSYLVIGTHSRSIEGKLIDVLLKNGWILEIERPAIFHLEQTKLVTAVDGVQGWRNPELLPEPQRINVFMGSKTLLAKFTGWYQEESTHRWCDGESCALEFTIPENAEVFEKINLKGFGHGIQRLILTLNGTVICKKILTSASEEIEIKVPTGILNIGLNKMNFDLPDAKVPENSDPRKLGFAMQELRFY